MSLFKNKNSKKDPIIKLDGKTIAAQPTPPTDNSKLWIDTSK